MATKALPAPTIFYTKNDLLGQPGSPLVVDQEGGVTQTGTSLGKAKPLGTRNSSVSQNTKNVNTDLMYGESNLANRTRKGQTAEALSRLGNMLEGAQTNVTRAAARNLGIDSAGKVVENVRKKTGLTNLETQAALAKELTGGENSLLDSIQRQALTAPTIFYTNSHSPCRIQASWAGPTVRLTLRVRTATSGPQALTPLPAPAT